MKKILILLLLSHSLSLSEEETFQTLKCNMLFENGDRTDWYHYYRLSSNNYIVDLQYEIKESDNSGSRNLNFYFLNDDGLYKKYFHDKLGSNIDEPLVIMSVHKYDLTMNIVNNTIEDKIVKYKCEFVESII